MKNAVTHNDVFHADDVFSTVVLRMVNPDVKVARTRNPEVIKQADVVFDVGAEYDPATNRFDHHQKNGAGHRPNGIKYAAFGLVWKKFGPSLVGDEIAQMVDEKLVQAVDASDNGQETYSPILFEGKKVSQVTIASVISSFNSNWNDDLTNDDQFEVAVKFAEQYFSRVVASCRGEIEARQLVRSAIKGESIIVLDTFCPWQDVVIKEAPEALFVVYPAETGDTWMVQAIPPELGSFDKKKALPEAWAGLRDKDLAEVSNVISAVFCHPGRFICGARTKDDAIALAHLACSSA